MRILQVRLPDAPKLLKLAMGFDDDELPAAAALAHWYNIAN